MSSDLENAPQDDSQEACATNLPGEEENMVLLYENLRRLARKYLRNDYQEQEIQATMLVHEAYLKLNDVKGLQGASKTKYFAYAAKAMRQILVSHYRKRSAEKRGGQLHKTTLKEHHIISIRRGEDVLALDEILHKLSQIDEFRARIVEMRFFAGMTI